MKFQSKRFYLAVLAFAFLCAVNPSWGQFYKLHSANIGVGASGQFTSSLTDQNTGSTGAVLPHQATTDSPGVVVTLRDQPFSWAGIEVNYQYTKFSEKYVLEPGTRTVPLATNLHEATAAYVFHPRVHRVAPFLAVGGGAVDFTLTDRQPNFNNQWRGAGLVDVGFELRTHSRLGFRIGARDLFYRAPDYKNAGLASGRWVSTEEPYAGVYFRL